MPARSMVGSMRHCADGEKVSVQCDLLSCDNDLYCSKHIHNATCTVVFYEYFQLQEWANSASMILIHDGGKSVSFCICCINKRSQKAWAVQGYRSSGKSIKQYIVHKYKIA